VQQQLTFRSASVDDVDAVVALVESAYRGESSKAGWTTEAHLLEGQRTDTEAVSSVVAAPEAHLTLAVDAATGELLGCCQLERREGGVAYFGTFAVRPGLQGRGVGKQLLAEAERRAREEWGAHTMEMTVIAQREDLIAWYARRGYRSTGETRPFPYGNERFGRPLRADLEFLVLAKELAAGSTQLRHDM
jgi:ribosomal protein S18 acetylase RimI-like enzyme